MGTTTNPSGEDFEEVWILEKPVARWRSAHGLGPEDGAEAMGSSILEVTPGHGLGRHTDSAEETVVVCSGTATVTVGDGGPQVVPAGGIALIPKDVPHEVHNAGSDVLRFVAVYAGTDVTTTYEHPVQPDGGRERKPVGE